MRIREFQPADLPDIIELTIETFRPYFEQDVQRMYGAELFQLHHGNWEQD